MSSYSQITFADYPVFENKNWYYKEVVSLIFQPEDFVIEKRKYSTRNKIVWGDAYENEAGYFEFKGFRQSVKVCKQRLEIYGNSLKKAKEEFASAKRLAKQEYHYEFSFRGITYNEYLLEIRDIITSKQKGYN
ncbi:MAG: HEPN/Toprim-associated domain-containing protein [Bacteroidota bacterium]